MASDIQQSDVIVLGSNKVAWWGAQENRLFAGRLSPLRCLAEGVAAFDVQEKPVSIDGLTLEDRKGLVAVWPDGKREALSVVGDGYGLLQNSVYWSILDQVYNGQAVVETAGTLGGGRRVWCLVAAGEQTVQPGDAVREFDLWVNSFDGSYSFCCIGTAIRVVCNNTLTLAFGKGRLRVMNVKHTANCETLARDAVNVLRASREKRLEEFGKMRAMARTPMGASEAESFFAQLMEVDLDGKVSTRQQNSLDSLNRLFSKGTGNLGRTRWDALNAVTEWSDYERTLRVGTGSREEARFTSAFLGSGADLKLRAFDLLTV